MPKFKFLDFNYNLLKVDDFLEAKDSSIVIYPTLNNANMAQAYSQHSWQFEDILYLAIEDFTDMVLPSSKIILEDDKRVIALYKMLTEEEKLFFKITDFFDFIKLANKIFTLFDELAVELLDFTNLIQVLEDTNSNLFPWQIEYYDKILHLLQRYESWLKESSLEDKIFLKKIEKISLDYFKTYKHIYVINQFYYTGLEREIIRQLEELGKDVTLVYQLPEAYVDKETFNAQDFKYSDLATFAHKDIEMKLVVDRNHFTMMNSLCRIISQDEVKQVIDRDFYETAYGRLLSRDTFDISYSRSFVNSKLYTFLGIIQQLIESIDYYNNQYYLPINVVVRAYLNSDFINYFAIENQENLLEELYNLSDRGLLYCDIKGDMGKETPSPALKASLQSIFRLLKKVSEIRSINSLISLFDVEDGIILDNICSWEELKYSNIKEVLYTELANLKSYTYNKLIDNWSCLSNKAEHIVIFKLFCDGLKAKKIKYTSDEKKKGVRINSLLDSRNNNYESLIFLNMIEGVLPTKRTSLFLFNEKQREVLGLKTYEGIRLREKYYFQRLVLTAKKSYFLAIESIDQNISISSFLEELPLVKDFKASMQADSGYKLLLAGLDQQDKEVAGDDFWQIKLDAQDLADGNSFVKLSYTKLRSLMDNPLAYLIHDWARVDEREILQDAQLDYKFIGIFAQDYVNHIIARIKDTFINQKVFYKFQFMKEDRLEEIYDSFLINYRFKEYYIPHNYSVTFLTRILKRALVEGMGYFFRSVVHNKLKLSEKHINLIPEEGFSYQRKQKYKSFIEEAENKYHLGVNVTGDADLRIENADDDSKVVIDFKTGRYSTDQLALYLYIYYWDDVVMGNEVNSGIFQILRQEWKGQRTTAEETINKLKNKIIEVLDEIALKGFSLPDASTKAKKFSKITRADLAIRR